MTAIRHEKADQSLILLLSYGYSPDGLITSISESGGPGGWATTTFTYDDRNRLILEFRDGLGKYGTAMYFRRVTSVTWTGAEGTLSAGYTYYSDDRVATVPSKLPDAIRVPS